MLLGLQDLPGGLNASNARQGIKTERAHDWRNRSHEGLNASNARQGIKTYRIARRTFQNFLRLNASNARQGIKTYSWWSSVAPERDRSERLQCPTGH